MPEKEKPDYVQIFGGILLIALVIAWLASPMPTAPPKPMTKAEIERMKTKEEINAFVMAQSFVKKCLKAPSTADFPYYNKGDVQDGGTKIWIVNSYVDSQNSFGAMMRTYYRAKVMDLGNDKWKLLDLKFNEMP